VRARVSWHAPAPRVPAGARLLQQAIDDRHQRKKLVRAWKEQPEGLIDLKAPRQR